MYKMSQNLQKRALFNENVLLPNPPRFVGWGIRVTGLILYTSHLLASFNFWGRPAPSEV